MRKQSGCGRYRVGRFWPQGFGLLASRATANVPMRVSMISVKRWLDVAREQLEKLVLITAGR